MEGEHEAYSQWQKTQLAVHSLYDFLFRRGANSYPKQSQSLTQQDWSFIYGPALLAMHTFRRLISSYSLEKPGAAGRAPNHPFS